MKCPLEKSSTSPAIAALTLLAVLRTLGSERPRRDLVVPAVALVVGIPAQALIGMVTVSPQS